MNGNQPDLWVNDFEALPEAWVMLASSGVLSPCSTISGQFRQGVCVRSKFLCPLPRAAMHCGAEKSERHDAAPPTASCALGAAVVSPELHLKGRKADRHKIAQLYRELGLNVQISTPGEEASVYQLLQLLDSNKLKVFASLSEFLAEYRIGGERSPLLLCCHSLFSRRAGICGLSR
jgi:hypothetical protein